jgi:hypothetical protein
MLLAPAQHRGFFYFDMSNDVVGIELGNRRFTNVRLPREFSGKRLRDESVADGSSGSPVAMVWVTMAIGVPHAVCAVGHRRSALVRISRIAWTHAKCALKTTNNTADDTPTIAPTGPAVLLPT